MEEKTRFRTFAEKNLPFLTGIYDYIEEKTEERRIERRILAEEVRTNLFVKSKMHELFDENKNEMAIHGLEKVAKEGKDISIAVPSLLKVIFSTKIKNAHVKAGSARALAKAAKNEKNRQFIVDQIIEKISPDGDTKNWGSMSCALSFLSHAINQDIDISIAFPKLNNLLLDKYWANLYASGDDFNIKMKAIDLFRRAAINGIDISTSFPVFLNLLVTGDGETYNTDYSRRTITRVLREAAETGADISLVIPKLIEFLGERDPDLTKDAKEALAYAVTNEKTRELTLRLLVESMAAHDNNIRLGNVFSTLEISAENCKSKKELVQFLRRMGGSLEVKELAKKIYNEWMDKQNKKIELQRPEMRKPQKKPNRNNLKRMEGMV
ncbi:hypothetical protein KAW38_01130 [Candidatus Micrarchaeota archaeon]|nr:hypothetical protein [Candidatus Micrarchaeota archaeon]